jgi:signal transduction histidine kinase
MHQNKLDAWEIKDTTGFLTALNIIGIAYDISGKLDSSAYYFTKTLELSKLYRNTVLEEKSTNNLGMMNWNKGNLFIAQSYFFDALKLSEKHGDEKRMSVALSNIGLIYQELSMYEKALKFHFQSLSIREKDLSLRKHLPLSYNNLAICYYNLSKVDSALTFANKGLFIANEINNKQAEANLLASMGNCYLSMKEYETALRYFFESLQAKNGQQKFTSIYKTYNSISEVYLKMGKPAIALEYALKSKAEIEQSGVNSGFELYYLLSQAYYSLGKTDSGTFYFEKANATKDSMFSEQHAHSFAELEELHFTKQKDEAINKFKYDLAQEQLKVKDRNQWLLFAVFGLIICAILALTYYFKQKFIRKQTKIELALLEKLSQAEIQNEINNERIKIAQDLHDNIGSQLTLIVSSIDNLSYKTHDNAIKQKLNQISAYTKYAGQQLRDTIWALNHKELTIEEFHLKVLDYISKARQSCASIKFSSSITGESSLVFKTGQGIHLLYVIQEIINNAIKYAQCTQINYQLQIKDGLLTVEITDNGIGFIKEDVQIGNGLLNIENRLGKLNAHYNLLSSPQNGTTYKIELKI